MRSNPIGRIVRNLLEAERKEAAYKEWIDNLFEPIGHYPDGHLPLERKSFVRLTNDLSHIVFRKVNL